MHQTIGEVDPSVRDGQQIKLRKFDTLSTEKDNMSFYRKGDISASRLNNIVTSKENTHSATVSVNLEDQENAVSILNKNYLARHTYESAEKPKIKNLNIISDAAAKRQR